MNSESFAKGMDDIEEHFGKRLKDRRFYWDEAKHIPSDAWTDIVRTRIRGFAPSPGNFPTIQVILDDWQNWLKSHPEKQAPIQWDWCQYCMEVSPGLIEVQIPLEVPVYGDPKKEFRNTIVRCRHCNNAQHRNPTWLRLTVNEIRDRGWIVVTKERKAREDDGDPFLKVRHPSAARSPGMKSIQDSLPVNDRDDQIPF